MHPVRAGSGIDGGSTLAAPGGTEWPVRYPLYPTGPYLSTGHGVGGHTAPVVSKARPPSCRLPPNSCVSWVSQNSRLQGSGSRPAISSMHISLASSSEQGPCRALQPTCGQIWRELALLHRVGELSAITCNLLTARSKPLRLYPTSAD